MASMPSKIGNVHPIIKPKINFSGIFIFATTFKFSEFRVKLGKLRQKYSGGIIFSEWSFDMLVLFYSWLPDCSGGGTNRIVFPGFDVMDKGSETGIPFSKRHDGVAQLSFGNKPSIDGV